MSIIGKALAGAGRATREATGDLMRAEIMRLRDARLNEYARSMKTEIDQPFARSERVEGEKFTAGEKAADRASAEEIAANRNKTTVEAAKIGAGAKSNGTTSAKKQAELEAQGYPRGLARAIAYDLVEKVQSPLGLETIWRDKASNKVVAKINEEGKMEFGPGWADLEGKGKKDDGTVNGLPSGSKQIGTSKGKPVYEAPDGTRYIVE